MSLFREEALKAEKEKWLGTVVISSPVKLKFFVLFIVCVLIALIIFISTSSYTRKQAIAGQLVPDLGLIKVYSPQYGVIISAGFEEGDHVKKGDTLFVISSDRETMQAEHGIQEIISQEISNRLKLLTDELSRLDEQFENDKKALRQNIEQAEEQLRVLNSQIENHRKMIQLVKNRKAQYEDLYKKNYIALDQVERTREELLSSELTLNNYQREKINAEKEINARQNELSNLNVKYEQQKLQYERNISSINQELAESESRREIFVQAPQSGTITAVTGQIGQYADGKRQLASIIPDGAELLAHLYAPSEAVGFLKEGAEVLLRYPAYPYQKFGQYRGIVASISKTALPKAELTDLIGANEYNPNVSLYRITIFLDSQTVSAYEEEIPLQAGMLVDADISVEKRKLYEWVFEPLFTLKGKLKN